jgi:hypothetical protein
MGCTAEAETEVEAEVELVTREDCEQCLTSHLHRALCLILRQLEVAYRMNDVKTIAHAVDSRPRFSHGPLPSRIVIVVSGWHIHFLSTTPCTHKVYIMPDTDTQTLPHHQLSRCAQPAAR